MIKPLLATAALLAAFTQTALASAQPSGPVRIVVPVAAGGGLDVVVRVLIPRLSERWKQTVIVDNRPGAGGNIGAVAVAKAPADGLTLLATQDQVMVANRFLFKALPYDPDKSFTPVAMLAQANQFILATPAVPANDLKELVALIKREKNKFAYGSYGTGSTPQLAFETLNKREGLDIVHVPYKGVAPVINALLGGEIPLSVGSAAVAGAHISAGKLKPLAIASRERDPMFPNVKTTAELGFPYLQTSIWHSLYAPAGTPPALVKAMAADIRAVLKEPEVIRLLAGFQLLDGGPEELAERNKEEVVRIREMVNAAGVQPE